ncbi:MAG: glycosyltransferase, partial [Mycobacterium leprae]
MTTAQWLYIILLCTYAALFIFFSRMFSWRNYAVKNFYNKRPSNLSESYIADLAHQEGKEIPFISIFVPARNEADVIEKTVDHLAHLRYFPDQYEVLVLTDEKEWQAAEQERNGIIESLTSFLAEETEWPSGEKNESVLIALLSRLALEEAQMAERKTGPYLSVREILSLSPFQR